jgi:hypothetical protein
MLKRFYRNRVLSVARGVDNLIIFIQKLRPSTHFKNLRIIELNDCEINDGDHVCIFIIYERLTIPSMTWNAIHAIKKMGIKVFAVINSTLELEEQAKIREFADISMFRRNTGKDIGAYKDAYLHLFNNGSLKKVNRLIFANDSVVYPAKFTHELFQKLVNTNTNMVGYSHVQEIHYHIQSFLFSCDNKLINDKIFVKFWQQYLPIDRRRHMIHKGEVGITKAVLKTGKKIAILNTTSDLINLNLSMEKIFDIIHSLPTASLHKLSVLENLKELNESFAFSLPRVLKDINFDISKENFAEISNDIDAYKNYKKSQFIRDLVYEVGSHNNTAWNTFIFLTLGLPVIIKRDSVYRAGYDYDAFIHYIRKYFDDESEEIMGMLKSPASSHLKGIKKIMFDHGII